MDRAYSSGAAGSAPTAPASPSTGYPTAGNPGTGTPATKPGPWWYHMITEELRQVIVAAGLTPDYASVTQMKSAMDILYATKAMIRGYIAGLTLANNGASQIDFAPGVAMDNSNSYPMILAATMTKTLQASGAFAAGSGNNGLFSGAKANSTWYHCFLIRKTSDGSIDCGFDTSVTAANIPAGYSAFRRVGSIKTDGSGNILAFTQVGDDFNWSQPVLDVSVSGLANGTTTYSINVPPGVIVEAIIQGQASSSSGAGTYHLNKPSSNDVSGYWAPTSVASATNASVGFGRARVRTNTSQQVQFNTNLSGTYLYMGAYGWVDSRGRHF